jgi:hypothetical protein
MISLTDENINLFGALPASSRGWLEDLVEVDLWEAEQDHEGGADDQATSRLEYAASAGDQHLDVIPILKKINYFE